MKTKILVILFFQFLNVIYSQELNIRNIIISHVYKNLDKEVLELSEEDGKGPYVKLELEFKNKSKKKIILSPSKAQIKISFRRDGKKYERVVLTHELQEINDIELNPNESFIYIVEDWLLYDTDIWVDKKMNYIIETLKILPTLKISYLEINYKKEIISKSIKNVELIDKDLLVMAQNSG
ncbi:MAG: hypothetical protein ACWA42_01765 [Lutibacter sp.]